MEKLENGVLIRDLISVVLLQKTSLCPLLEFLKVWYVLFENFTCLQAIWKATNWNQLILDKFPIVLFLGF